MVGLFLKNACHGHQTSDVTIIMAAVNSLIDCSNQGTLDGVVCQPGTFPGGNVNRFNLGDTAVHEVSAMTRTLQASEG